MEYLQYLVNQSTNSLIQGKTTTREEDIIRGGIKALQDILELPSVFKQVQKLSAKKVG